MDLKTVLTQLKSVVSFFYTKDENALTEISEQEYKNEIFGQLSEAQLNNAYNRAWEAKNFENENYWKRANYFWAFQVASFAGYFSVLSSDLYNENTEVIYYVICIGFVTSIAWTFINIGSKTWQRHWEIHVDLLEDKITGPLYKIVTTEKTYSVSKINEIISRYFTVIWLIIGIQFLYRNTTFKFTGLENIQYSLLFSTFTVIYFTVAMYHGYGRGRFGNRKVKLFKRQYDAN